MKQEHTNLEKLNFIGIKARTNNEIESGKDGVIPKTIHKYFTENIAGRIQNRKNSGITFCAYTEYESDHTGEYTYFVGEEVTSIDEVPEGLELLSVPASNYTKFTIGPGKMPEICIQAWQQIWQMDESALGGKRSFMTDFEVYDYRRADPQNTIFDLYINLKK